MFWGFISELGFHALMTVGGWGSVVCRKVAEHSPVLQFTCVKTALVDSFQTEVLREHCRILGLRIRKTLTMLFCFKQK